MWVEDCAQRSFDELTLDCEVLISENAENANQIDYEEDVVADIDLEEGRQPIKLEPFAWHECTNVTTQPQQGISTNIDKILLLTQLAVDKEYWQDGEEPQEVLGRHNLIKNDKCPGLYSHSQEDVIVEEYPS